ncbi:MAG TPA: right-handed parallel beta-helix repeat-containing protein [Pyrinomonadaceae bacterium]|jgi:hypothetical protein
MTKVRSLLQGLALLIFVLAAASLASAQATRTWVSGVGDDANPCSRTAPCKTFAGAISKTAKDGEINAIDPGGFGAITITKSITIDGAGTQASILAAGTNGVNVNVTDAADVRKTVRLRNLSINGAASGVHGISAIAFSKLFVENVVISGFQFSAASRGIRTTAGNQVFVKDTNISNCASGVDITSVALVSFTLDNVRVEGMTDGVILQSNANGAIRNSVISLNSGSGLKVTGGTSNVELESCEVQQNGTGVTPANGGTVVFSNTSVFGNSTGVATVAGSILTSHGNNQFTLNGGGSVPTSIGQQ